MRIQTGLACCLVLAAFGCGSDEIAIDDLADELARAQCDQAVRCGTMPDLETCLDANVIAGNVIETAEQSVKDGIIKFDGEIAADCVAQIRNASCEFPGFFVDDPCLDMLAGTLGAGESCFVSDECANFGDCVPADPDCNAGVACCPGTCDGGVVVSDVGGPCNDGANVCDETIRCVVPQGGGVGICEEPLAVGSQCDNVFACENPAICNLTTTGTCDIPAATDAECDPEDLIACGNASQFCDEVALLCTDNVDVGAQCNVNGSECFSFATCIGGTCVADPILGEACSDTTADCLARLDCVGGICTAADVGIACE